MRNLLRPYADLRGIFDSVEYRGSPAESFEPLDPAAGVVTRVVRVDDLRAIPAHQLKIRINRDALKPHYEHHADKVFLTILVRDTILRKEVRLAEHQIDSIPSVIDLDRAQLRCTGLRDVLPLDLVVVWKGTKSAGIALPTQLASRLAELQIVLRNTAGGASFPYKRVTTDELRDAGLPSETAVHLKLFGDSVELLKESDTPVKNLFEVWVHEKIWAAVQNDGSPASASLRVSAITLTVSNLLLSVVLPHVKDGQAIERNSAIGQLLAFVEKQASKPEGYLVRELQESASLHTLQPFLQNAWRFVSSAARVDEETPE